MEAENRILMHGSIFKDCNNKYCCVLSDDSVDRQDEIVTRSFFEDSIKRKNKVRMMMDHNNQILMRIGDWQNQRIESVKGHNALVAEPKFFMSNPNAVIIKGMLDEGAELDLSIGALTFEHENVQKGNKSHKAYTKGEVLEASYVGIGANKNSTSSRIAKSLGLIKQTENKTEEVKMDEDAISKLITEQVQSTTDRLDALDKVLGEIKKELEEQKVEPDKEPVKDKVSEENKSLKVELEKVKLDNIEFAKKVKELESVYKQKQDDATATDLQKLLPIL